MPNGRLKFDFAGWATRNDLECSDGRIIRRDAFAHCDGKKVPLVWMHKHGDVSDVLGHAFLENRPEGVYAYGVFNNSEYGQNAKEAVMHGDIDCLSIFANHLRETPRRDVLHGDIQELSLVLSGANPGAFVEEVFAHGEDGETTGMYIGYDERGLTLYHDDDDDDYEDDDYDDDDYDDDDDETVEDIYNSMSERQQDVCDYLVQQALESSVEHSDYDDNYIMHYGEEGGSMMRNNVFENSMRGVDYGGAAIFHSNEEKMDFIKGVVEDAKTYGSFKESFLAHADDYGIEDIEFLFPDAKTLNNPPEFLKRDDSWVGEVINGTHHSPFSRIKSVFADITEDEARAKGYFKGKKKKEEIFSLLKRSTGPTTIYKKQKIDRDDTIDITDFDVIAWIKSEMRVMYNEELARCVLFGDGRLASSDDKVDESCVRPIWKDDPLFTINYTLKVASGQNRASEFVDATIKSRKGYKGSGKPIMFIGEDLLTECLLLKDNNGRFIYKDVDELAKIFRVSKIVEVSIMDGLVREVGGKTMELLSLVVNLTDYTIGADKGGQLNFFDDFDIDYNQMKYLYESRCSGALTKPFAAIAVEQEVSGAQG